MSDETTALTQAMGTWTAAATKPGGVDLALAAQVVAEAQGVLMGLMQTLGRVQGEGTYTKTTTQTCPGCGGKVSVTKVDVAGLARAGAQVMRTVDECARLALFCQGQPDHRVEVSGPGGQDLSWLAGLTAAQVAQVQAWVEANQAAAAAPAVEGP